MVSAEKETMLRVATYAFEQSITELEECNDELPIYQRTTFTRIFRGIDWASIGITLLKEASLLVHVNADYFLSLPQILITPTFCFKVQSYAAHWRL
jgi:hypothetical protein